MSLHDFSDIQLDYSKIAKDTNSMALTRLLAKQLMEISYITVGDFMLNLTDYDLQSLIELIDKKPNPRIVDFVLIAEMLAIGEGCGPSDNTKVFEHRTSMLTNFIIMESLSRKNLIELEHKNMSFHEDMADKQIARAK